MERKPIRQTSRRVTVASYGSYEEAQRAVDRLSDEGFAVDRLSIVAEDLRSVERVAGYISYFGAAFCGAGSGAVIGALFGFYVGFFDLISHTLTGGERNFSSERNGGRPLHCGGR